MRCPLCKNESFHWCTAPDEKEYFRCNGCALVFLDPAFHPTPAKERARYEEHNNLLDSVAYISYLERLSAPVAARLDENQRRGLDFGCGPVEGMRHILEPLGFLISSYDPYFFPREELLKFSYDFVLCSEVVEHFFQPEKGFEQLQNCLKKGGILGVSSQFYPEDPQVFAQWGYRRDPTHVVFFAEKTVRWLAGRYGWELLNIKSPIWVFRKN